jgi:lysophospholipase L1-like esterase
MRRLAPLGLAVASALLALIALDRLVAMLDLGYAAARGRPGEDRLLVREEFAVHVRLNALGFREPRLPSPKPAGVRRAVALGDSFTQGFGVEASEAWPALLESRLAGGDSGGRWEVLNLGVPGTNPRDALEHLRAPGLAYAPDVVVVLVMGNDVQDRWVQRRFGVAFGADVLREARRAVLAPASRWSALPQRVLPALYPLVWTRLASLRTATAATAPRAASARAAAVPAAATPEPDADATASAAAVFRELAARFEGTDAAIARWTALPASARAALAPVLIGTVPLDADAAADPYLRTMALVAPRLFADAVLLPPDYDDAAQDVARQVERIVALARAHGAQPLLAFAPAVQQVTEAARPHLEQLGFVWDPRTLTEPGFSASLAALARDLDVPYVDLLPVLRARADVPTYFPHDGHWTPAGHALVADIIAAHWPAR